MQKLDDLLLNLVVFEAHRIKSMTPLQAVESAKQLHGYPQKAQENKRSHADSILPSLAAEDDSHSKTPTTSTKKNEVTATSYEL